LGRLAQFRPIDSRLVDKVDATKPGERLIVIGTPKNQPALAALKLPLKLKGDRWLDEKQQPLGDDVGLLMLTTAADGKALVMVATGNTPAAANKAVQFLVQNRDRQIGTGRLVMVNQLAEVPTPARREWQGYLPTRDTFQLKEMPTHNNEPFPDVTTRGSDAPPIEFDFRGLPDDKFLPGSVMNLRYSYGPQLNPLTSLLEVQLDGLPLAGRKLDAVDGVKQGSFKVELPADKIKPNSKIQVRFQLDPRERRSCNRPVDQQLWGTVHADTQFDLKRENMAQVPDLRLVQVGYPFAAPQDLSETAIALPQKPALADLRLMLEVAERLGRVSRAESIKLNVYRADKLPAKAQQERHLIAIGQASRFPLPDALKAEGFTLQQVFERKNEGSKIRTLPDVEGVVKQIISPWNAKRTVLLLTGQTDQGLKQLQDLFAQDSLFYQLQGDTTLISANTDNPSPYDPNSYTLEFLTQAKRNAQLSEVSWRDRLVQTLGGNWLLLVPGTVVIVLLAYGISQAWLNRYAPHDKQEK